MAKCASYTRQKVIREEIDAFLFKTRRLCLGKGLITTRLVCGRVQFKPTTFIDDIRSSLRFVRQQNKAVSSYYDAYACGEKLGTSAGLSFTLSVYFS